MMLCSRGPFFQKESPRNEIKGVDWFLVLIGKKAKMATGTRKGKGANRLKKFARKWICEGIALAELRRTLNTSTRKGRKADGPYCAPRGLFPIFRLFPLRSVFELGLRSSGLSYPWVRRLIFFILERSRNYIFNRNLFTNFIYFSFYKILTLLFLRRESEGSSKIFFEVPGGKDSNKRFLPTVEESSSPESALRGTALEGGGKAYTTKGLRVIL